MVFQLNPTQPNPNFPPCISVIPPCVVNVTIRFVVLLVGALGPSDIFISLLLHSIFASSEVHNVVLLMQLLILVTVVFYIFLIKFSFSEELELGRSLLSCWIIFLLYFFLYFLFFHLFTRFIVKHQIVSSQFSLYDEFGLLF